MWVHEVSHLLRDHHGRGDRVAKERGLTGRGDRLRINIAADCEINDDAYGDGLARPDGCVDPERLGLARDGLMEDYLRQFQLGPYTQDFVWLDCGSGADGLDREWDLGPDGAHGLSPQERDAVRFRVARGITGRPGDVPQGWRRWAQEAFHPPQPWRDLLGAAVRSAATTGGAGEDYTYGRPARRSAGLPGVVLPALRRRPPRVCVVVDTSGSVSDAELGSALLEVAAIGRALGGRRDLVSVLSCDVAAGAARRLCRAEESRWSAAVARTCVPASPGRCGPGRTSWWSSPTGRRPGRTAVRRAGRWWASSPGPVVLVLGRGRPGPRAGPPAGLGPRGHHRP
ncbi:hypothetical protein GCM10027605_22540 [Micromonospora zhanjiangensis]